LIVINTASRRLPVRSHRSVLPLFRNVFRRDAGRSSAPSVSVLTIDTDDVVMMAHDARNLLAVIDVEGAAERADQILLQLTSLDRQVEKRSRAVDVNDVVAAARPLLERAAGERIRLQVLLASACERVLAERFEVERILMNLVISSRYAMPEGGTLTVQTSSLVQVPAGLKPPYIRADAYVRITVSDTGAGMPSGIRARILDQSPLRKRHGTELGLAAVVHTVRSLHGAVHIASDEGQGTQFNVDLPCQ
jgi:signal transduction histidine kinase